jgi:hypothetical protein
MFFLRRHFCSCLLALLLLPIPGFFSPVGAQGLQQTPYSAADVLRRGPSAGLGLTPYNSLGLPGSSMGLPSESSSLYISDGMLRTILPLIPNLQFGFLYDFGNNKVSAGRFAADYVLPFSVGDCTTFFGEAHGEFTDFWKTNGVNNRVDMSFGGGFRTFLRRDTLLGLNGFYDTSRLGGTWYSSGGIGLEMAALIGNDALDLNANWYGQVFNSAVIVNAFRYGPSNFRFQTGYSHELWNGGPDLRLSATGYQFDIGNSVYGWNAGAELKTRDRVFVLRYDVGNDRVNQTYQTVGGFVNLGFQPENILKGESPFTMPEPIFKSPRSLRYMLTQPVKRDWHQPAAIVVTRRGQGGCGNLDRFLASVTMGPYSVHSPPGNYRSHIPVPSFPAVPNTCLDPSKHIVVEFDYAFDVTPRPTPSWGVEVGDASQPLPIVSNGFVAAPVPTGLSGHLSFILNTYGTPTSDQSAFTVTATDPVSIDILVINTGLTNTLTITNVVIHFNQ